MRGIVYLIFYLFFTIIVIAKSYSLDEIIDSLDKNSSFEKIKKYEKEKNIAEKKELLYEKYFELKIDSKIEIFSYEDRLKLPSYLLITENIVKNPIYYYLKLSYNEFELLFSYDCSTGKNLRSNCSVGFSKCINDFIYDEKVYKSNLYRLKSQIEDIEYKKNRNIMISKIIDNYLEIKNMENEMELKKKLHTEAYRQLKIKEEIVKIGEALASEIANLEYEIIELEEEMETIRHTLDIKKEELANTTNFQGNLKEHSYELEDLRDINIELRISDYELERKDLEIEKERENMKLYNRKNQVELTTGVMHDFETKVTKAFFQISGEVFGNNYNSEVSRNNIDSLEVEKNDLMKKRDIAKRNLQMEYNKLEKKVELAEKRLESKSKRFEVVKSKYKEGNISETEYIKESREHFLLELKLKQLKNEFQCFKYRIFYKGI